MSAPRRGCMLVDMARFMLEHTHTARECGAVFASFKAFRTPLRHRATVGSCHFGGHRIWWQVEAESADDALAQLPGYVAQRTSAIPIRDLETP
jgi:hypothetical protein